MMGGWESYGYGNGAWSWLFMFLMMALFFLGLVLLIRYFGGDWHRDGQGENALDVLKKRYAKGEIDKKEFEEKRKDLTS